MVTVVLCQISPTLYDMRDHRDTPFDFSDVYEYFADMLFHSAIIITNSGGKWKGHRLVGTIDIQFISKMFDVTVSGQQN